jgi:hypothetical protein
MQEPHENHPGGPMTVHAANHRSGSHERVETDQGSRSPGKPGTDPERVEPHLTKKQHLHLGADENRVVHRSPIELPENAHGKGGERGLERGGATTPERGAGTGPGTESESAPQTDTETDHATGSGRLRESAGETVQGTKLATDPGIDDETDRKRADAVALAPRSPTDPSTNVAPVLLLHHVTTAAPLALQRPTSGASTPAPSHPRPTCALRLPSPTSKYPSAVSTILPNHPRSMAAHLRTARNQTSNPPAFWPKKRTKSRAQKSA